MTKPLRIVDAVAEHDIPAIVDYWLVAGIFHALRDPDWILSQALIREAAE